MNDPQHGFSVATLLLLTAVVAIGAAAVRNLVVAPDVDERLNPASSRAIQASMQEAPVRGMVVGPLAGAVLTDPRNLLLAAIGSAVLLLLGSVVRMLSHHP